MFFGRFMEFALILSLWPFVICPSFVNNSWKNRITTMINQCSLTRFQTAPPIFRPNWGPKGRKKFFWDCPPPLISGPGWPGPPLICRSGPPLQAIMVERLVKFCFLKAWRWFLLFFSREARSHNLHARIRGLFFGFLGILLPFVLLVNFLASTSAKGTLDNFVGKNVSEKLHVYTVRAILFSTRQC